MYNNHGDSMNVYCLMDDTAGEGFCCEHGLSLYIETKKHRILADCGQSALTFRNAEKLGIDISSVDTLILSHGHYDHTGGTFEFRRLNSKASIYIRSNADGDFYNLKNGNEKYIGADKNLFNMPGLVLTDGNTEIDDEISLFTQPGMKYPMPGGNKILVRKTDKGFADDDFSHEQYAVISENGKRILVSGCAHRGILNILYEFKGLYGCSPDAVITGFHTVKAEGYGESDISELEGIAAELMKFDTVFYTGHCTSVPGYDIMKKVMGEKLILIHSGDKLI